MRKYLSIVIPRYNETEKDVFPLLSSISGQAGIDFNDIEVIIANDGGGIGELNHDFLSMFSIDIKQVSLSENKGPGVARQAGLDIAQGEYVMFCDADDMLHNVGVLGALMQEAEKNAPDIITSSWIEEVLIEGTGQYQYITYENDNTWMHGKFLRRQFLVQNNIRFHDSLRVHEDSYLLAIAAALTNRRIYIPVITYVWKFRPDSITRRNSGAYTYESMPTFIEACTMAHGELEKRLPRQLEGTVLQFVLYNYFTYHLPHWLDPEHSEYLKKAEEAFVKYIAPFWHYWKNAAPEAIANIYNMERARSFAGCMEKETVWEWIDRLGLNG